MQLMQPVMQLVWEAGLETIASQEYHIQHYWILHDWNEHLGAETSWRKPGIAMNIFHDYQLLDYYANFKLYQATEKWNASCKN